MQDERNDEALFNGPNGQTARALRAVIKRLGELHFSEGDSEAVQDLIYGCETTLEWELNRLAAEVSHA